MDMVAQRNQPEHFAPRRVRTWRRGLPRTLLPGLLVGALLAGIAFGQLAAEPGSEPNDPVAASSSSDPQTAAPCPNGSDASPSPTVPESPVGPTIHANPKPGARTPGPRWVCGTPAQTSAPVWRGQPMEFRFEIRNEGTETLRYRPRGG